MTSTDTIFALSSGPPPAAIAVIRLSGPHAGNAMRALTGRTLQPRRASLVTVRDPHDGARIDQALGLWLPGPDSETGEDCAELQVHGGRAVIAATLSALGQVDGLRGAEAGEFTRRALANGRIDLTAVEALADLVGAETEAQRHQAFAQMTGGISSRADSWRERLVSILARVEADIDFADEGDVPDNVGGGAGVELAAVEAEVRAVLDDGHRGERIREGITVAISGPPNVGKSSIMNWLARRDVAIVSPTAGTTRDVIEVHLDLQGYPVTIVDTAGIRETDDPVEREGIRRARDRAARADITLWVEDATRPSHGSDNQNWVVWNKTDLVDSDSKLDGTRVSALTGAGMAELQRSLSVEVARRFQGSHPAMVTRSRHREALEVAADSLRRGAGAGSAELMAEDIRLSLRALERLLGRVDVEEVLDKIFGEFCIGK